MKSTWVSFSLALVLMTSQAIALTEGAQKLVEFETHSNAVSERSSNPIRMPHYEIPLEMVQNDFADRFSPEARAQFIFEKNGRQYLRWVLNPEDTKWYLEVEKHFAEKGIHLEKKYYFIGRQTASRSYIIEDPQKRVQFSIKSSTDKTGGNWSDKKQPVGEAIDSRLNADFLKDVEASLPFKNLVLMDEPAIMKLPDIDQAVVLRDLADLNTRTDRIYLPGFSALHEKAGAEIALKNGSKDPYAFWTEHYIKAVAHALGELAARTGMQFDSPHSQNFLIELDANYKPTGRIVLRDLADLYIDKTYIRNLHKNPDAYFKDFTQKSNLLSYIAVAFGPLHGNTFPQWVNDANYSAWKDVFLVEFEKSFTEVSGLNAEAFRSGRSYINGRYFGQGFTVPDAHPTTVKYWHNMRRYGNPQGVMSCQKVFH